MAFQPCIPWGGVNIVKIGEKHDFVQILGLKTPISVDRNFEHLTSEGPVTPKFEMSLTIPKICVTYRGFEFLNGRYGCSKLEESAIFNPSPKIGDVTKKDTASISRFET